ncbi:odorant receptor 118-1 [Danio rerio]|uniref:Olfactory receptor n=1 Tax=Danio rerio TaxID=7955 RepID=Q2PRD9_DANRE|nr:odorant receptor 118-1 [Danio rerio]ABC43328.1 odorant receptor [Danio rerio]|eukprot:NP_001121850.1 odorant receptor, family F, subfamily 118, member 1 [Danio rerio]
MYPNESVFSLVLTLHSLELPEANIYPAFIFGLTTYLFILLCNLTIIITICLNRNLHKPMYILLLNLPINDVLGATCLFPQLLYSIWSQDRSISYSACLLQGFFVHLNGGASYLILTAMAYDRYITICCPLRYGAIMTTNNLLRIIIGMWLFNVVAITVICVLLLPYRICQTHMTDLVCYKTPLMKLLCDGIEVNNIYGLCCIIFYHGLALSVVAFTYIHILITCVTNKQSDARVKALQTCGTHLVVFLLLEINTLFPLLAHRSEIIPAFLRRVFSISNFIFPPLVNPLIYGFKTKEIRLKVFNSFKSKINSI